MIRALKTNWIFILTGFTLLTIVALFPAVVSAAADIQDSLESGTCLTVSGAPCNVSDGTAIVDETITNVINIFSIIVGIVAVIMLIFGGFRYVTSGGDSGNIGTAKNTILYAIVGLVIVAISQAIVQFVLDKSVQ